MLSHPPPVRQCPRPSSHFRAPYPLSTTACSVTLDATEHPCLFSYRTTSTLPTHFKVIASTMMQNTFAIVSRIFLFFKGSRHLAREAQHGNLHCKRNIFAIIFLFLFVARPSKGSTRLLWSSPPATVCVKSWDKREQNCPSHLAANATVMLALLAHAVAVVFFLAYRYTTFCWKHMKIQTILCL